MQVTGQTIVCMYAYTSFFVSITLIMYGCIGRADDVSQYQNVGDFGTGAFSSLPNDIPYNGTSSFRSNFDTKE
jgi:hypothetical protein